MSTTINCDRCGKLCSQSSKPVCRFAFGILNEKERAGIRVDFCATCQKDAIAALTDIDDDGDWANEAARGRLESCLTDDRLLHS